MGDARPDAGPDVPLPLAAYNSVWQLRADAWNSLQDATKRLLDATARGIAPGALVRQVDDLLGLLDPMEHYWAFPGPQHLLHLRELVDQGAYDRLHMVTARITCALAGDADPSGLFTARDKESDEPAEPAAPPAASGRPRFEVLVVDAMSPYEEAALREELRRLRRPADRFSYELVVVPSFEDALVAVLFNVNLQACVLRHGFAVASQHDLRPLRHFIADIPQDEVDRLPVSEQILLLGERIAELRPELDLYLMTQVSVEEIAGQLDGRFQRVFHHEDALDLHLSILAGVQARYQTPFFSALRDYSRQPTGVFHALPISRGEVGGQLPLDPGHARVLRAQHVPGRNLRHGRRAGLAARSGWTDQVLAGAGRAGLRRTADPFSLPTAPPPRTRSSCSRS